ncbi:bifunctional GNAT family N-acetyltransferase/carbon-nitrogen hydrolase family protein [Penaeicola halotolerans]|uniref:bifunctional GNAT family N-acetyltransferase/carbon-nitrogen hydrolase family protein n=1 Tax=Penaeicola halotolerans TaxID=2793196 RepID=UPI001CF8DB78|nr:bifunctional GNAT family N-acetyltransferase/carbon-nitrogen hydrolase family protein [Penaeicola halotolerans]
MSLNQELEHRLKLRNCRLADYQDIKEIMTAIYSDLGAWTKQEFKKQLNAFPEGQICIEDNGKVVAAALSLIVKYDKFGDNHTYDEITGNGQFDTHDYEGETLYGTDVFVHPDYRGMRLGRRLYDARKELCENLNLRAIIAGGRIPGYSKYADQLTPRKYIELVKNKEIYDPVLSFQLANEFHVRKVITKYLPEDTDSRSYATLLEWINIYYEKDEKLIGNKKSVVRLGIVQWKMRRTVSVADLMQQVEFFVDTVAGYNSDFCMFPEFFNAPLMAQFNDMGASDAVRALSDYTEEIKDAMVELALSYNVNIIAGSMPEYDGQKLRNVSYLCRRDGTYEKQYKLHVTPDEALYWGMQGGNKISTFDTDAGKIGILICYDVEFPELGRLLAEQNMDILFVPFWTDTKNAFLRVSTCAKARAIENECYVAISGSVGNLPKVENMDIQYSQAAVFSPSDFSFPHDAIVAEASANTETTLIADVDLELLMKQRMQGSVRNLEQRRTDLYQITWGKKTKK